MKYYDRNAFYFHMLAFARARFNSLAKLVVGGMLVEDKDQIVDHVVGFYKSLFKDLKWALDWMASISKEENDMLQSQISESVV